MGYLLSPHFGSRHRLMMITTDALVSYDQPVDYGVQAFCTICQVCVNRCPGRALTRDKVWWRGIEKFKIIAQALPAGHGPVRGLRRLHEGLPPSSGSVCRR